MTTDVTLTMIARRPITDQAEGTLVRRNHVTVVKLRRGKKRKGDVNLDQNPGVLLIDHHPKERKAKQSIPRFATERSHVEGHQKTQVTSHPPIVQVSRPCIAAK
uniref:uncharacterized protein LOC104266034 n=1 Tax=Ciona intestinalis TaxID=7719 RepID=UPI000EF48472|nr:uncharacterized protein LOC104266034 [Ciona intestinalis]|eukprot:XP_009859691.3 uncharacterized protein LOC104266034 [Ciona intestinalis]